MVKWSITQNTYKYWQKATLPEAMHIFVTAALEFV